VEKRTAAPRTAPPTSPPSASEPAESTPTSDAATTTTAPLRPTSDDIELLGFAQSFELTARDLYQAALDGGLADGDLSGVFRALRDNHEEYANRLSGILGVDAPQRRDDALFDELAAGFEGGDAAAVAAAALDMEATAVATHNDLLGRLQGIDGIAAVASFVVVEARHGTVLADVAGDGDDLDALLTSDAGPLEVPASPSGWRAS
jgi:Ferritin-like domain